MAKRVWLIIAVVFVLCGGLTFAVAMQKLDWNFYELSTSKYETNTYKITENFENISLSTDTEDIAFFRSDNGECRVECVELANAKNSVFVEDNTLTIKEGNGKWYNNIGFNLGSPNISVFLPNDQYNSLTVTETTGDIKISDNLTLNRLSISVSTGDIHLEKCSIGSAEISTSTGDIKAKNVNCDNDLSINVTTGDVKLENIKCQNLISKGNTGDVSLKQVIAVNKLSLKRTTGDIKLKSADGGEVFIETDTGDVYGTLLSDKIFITESSIGDIKVPKTTSGGKCEIKTDTGNIKIGIEK